MTHGNRHKLEISEETGESTVGPEVPDTNGQPFDISDINEEGSDILAMLKAERARADDEHDRYLRALADFSNFKRRHEERQASVRQFAARDIIIKLLAIVDDFERALRASEKSHSYNSLKEGLELTLRKLQSLLETEGVKPIDAVGEQFDPAIHEAVMRVENGEYTENSVVSEVQKGYMLASEVLRPSRVTVAVAPDTPAADPEK